MPAQTGGLSWSSWLLGGTQKLLRLSTAWVNCSPLHRYLLRLKTTNTQNKNKHLLVFLLFHSSIPSYNRIILSHTLVILLDFFPLSWVGKAGVPLLDSSDSQARLHMRITWGAFKTYECLGPTPRQLNHNLWGQGGQGILFNKNSQMIPVGSQGWVAVKPEWTELVA